MKVELLTKIYNPHYFHLILFPTEACSFRCTYCYEDFSTGRMTPEIVLGVKRLIEARCQSVQHFHISWFGGEPLLASDIVLDIQSFVQSLKGKFKFTADMSTNGYALNGPLVEKLCESGVVVYQISLDGSREFHNKTRVGKGGFPTFDRIMKNLHAMREVDCDFTVVLRLHFHPGNVTGIKELVRQLCADFGCDKRFKLFFKGVANMGGSGSQFVVFAGSSCEQLKRELEACVPCREMIFSGITAEPICYAARLDSFGIRASGKIVKCTVALNDPKNDLGVLDSSGRLIIDSEKIRYWARGVDEIDGGLPALRCPLHPH